MNTLKDLLTENELKLHEELGYPANVYIIHNALLEKLKTEPDYEVWVPFKYYKYLSNSKSAEQPFIENEHLLISNKGNLHHLRKQTKAVEGVMSTTGYYRSKVREEDTVNDFSVHRAIACCFIPVPEDLTHIPVTKLQVNHKNTIKTHNDFSNLEWCTGSYNVLHAIDNNLRTYHKGEDHYATKPLKATVVADNAFKGYQFIIAGKDQQVDLGVHGSATRVANGELKQAKGCVFEYFQPNENILLPVYSAVPDEVKNVIRKHDNNFKDKIVGMDVATKEVAEFVGTASMKARGFVSAPIYQHMTGDSLAYKGWVFVREPATDSREDTIARLNEKANLFLQGNKPRKFEGTNIATGEKVIFTGKEELDKTGLNYKRVYAAARDPSKTHKGYTFIELT